jgi:tetratricopeptide (TPR) repeat protein
MTLKKVCTRYQTLWAGFTFLFLLSTSAFAADDAQSSSERQEIENKTVELLTNIDAFNTKDERLRADSAKAHYNMGNIYFYKGEYEIAAREYFQAVTLMPNDADSHFNLAFVSGEHLKDYKTALKHYRMYLFLSPDAKDRKFVSRKIIDAETYLKSLTGSYLEQEENQK